LLFLNPKPNSLPAAKESDPELVGTGNNDAQCSSASSLSFALPKKAKKLMLIVLVTTANCQLQTANSKLETANSFRYLRSAF